ncbi:putative conserved secreted protein [Synechococcus sp. BIOS-U3-1]|nr:putative conserved secreted protein [Synechococcus sp. BIOS-U3-1]
MLRATSLCLTLMAAVPLGVSAQGMLPGCRLDNGSLQCVPGLTASPEKQIQVLDGQIQQGLQQEGHLQQAITGLQRFALVGEAREGALLKAVLKLEGADIDELDVHWYRRSGQGNWTLVESGKGHNHRVGPEDRDDRLMAVLVVRGSNGNIQRISSNVIGPIHQ